MTNVEEPRDDSNNKTVAVVSGKNNSEEEEEEKNEQQQVSWIYYPTYTRTQCWPDVFNPKIEYVLITSCNATTMLSWN